MDTSFKYITEGTYVSVTEPSSLNQIVQTDERRLHGVYYVLQSLLYICASVGGANYQEFGGIGFGDRRFLLTSNISEHCRGCSVMPRL